MIFSGSRYRLFSPMTAEVGLPAEEIDRDQAVGMAGVVGEDVAGSLRAEMIGPWPSSVAVATYAVWSSFNRSGLFSAAAAAGKLARRRPVLG